VTGKELVKALRDETGVDDSDMCPTCTGKMIDEVCVDCATDFNMVAERL
jgi:hypothetical protein